MRREGRVIVSAGIALLATTVWAAAPPCRLVVAADKLTVKDGTTGLTWQRDVPAQPYIWSDARNYCTSLSLGSFTSGWRLPTIRDLQTLVDLRASNPAIDGVAFPNTPSENFWSSSVYSDGNNNSVWFVGFGNGASFHGLMNLLGRVRCVRSS